MDDWETFYECENQDCPYLELMDETFVRQWTEEDEALEKADLMLDCQKDGDL